MEKSQIKAGSIEPANEEGAITEYKLDPAGRALRPTPTSDPLDPLNWSVPQKYTCISIVCYSYFLLTYLTTAPIPSFATLETQLNVDYSQISWTFAVPCLGLAVGPVLVGALADVYGRRPILMASTAIVTIASGCLSVPGITYAGYMAARFFQGLGAGPAANVGLVIINDVSWEYQRGLRVGLWTVSANLGTCMGGIIGGLIASSGDWVNYHVTILYVVLFVAIFAFLPETLYPRALIVASEANHEEAQVTRTKQLGRLSLKKVPGVPYVAPWTTALQFLKLFSYPTIAISVLAYCLLQYWWICGVTTLIPDAYVDDTPAVQGAFLVGLLLGLLSAEVFCSGHLSDKIMLIWVRKHAGARVPETRLWLGMPAAISSALGLLIWGLSVDGGWHWITGQVAFFLYGLGVQTGNTVLSAYIVDNYPDHANETITFYTVIINLSAFILPWFIYLWVEATGYTWCFAAQCIICAFGLIPCYAFLIKFGPRMRAARPMYKKELLS